MTQLRAYAAVYGILEPATPGAVLVTDPTVSARLKVLSPRFARRVTSILADAGLLDPDDVAG